MSTPTIARPHAHEESRAIAMLDDDQAFASFYRWRLALECESTARSLREQISVEEYVAAIYEKVPHD